jgi:serine/threonine protein kinase
MTSSGPDETPQPSELGGLDPKDLLKAGLETVPPVTLPPQPVDPDATIAVAGPRPSQPAAPQVELPLPEELTQLLPAGAYKVESFLGQGGMGAVYKASQVRLKRPVAIKIMRRDVGKDHDFEARFEREAQAMAKLNHPNIVSVIDFGEAGPDYLYIVMELIDGADMMDVIRGGQMTQEMALTLLPQVCDALQFAHDHGIVHRDIKPSNIMLTRDGRVKMCDFGLAKRYDLESSFRTQTGTGMGTPDYAAPEQFDPNGHIDHRADIYALGVMIYQMITGQLPRGVWKPPSQRAEISPQWDDIVSRAMQSDPSDRYQHASDIKTDVSSIPLSGRVRKDVVSQDEKVVASHALASAATKSRARAPLLFGLITGTFVLVVGAFYAFKSSRSGETPVPVETSQSNQLAPPPLIASPPTGWNAKASRAAAELALTKSNSVIIEQNGKTLSISHSQPLPLGDFRFIGFFTGNFSPPQTYDDLAKGMTEAELKAMLAPIELERVNVKSVRVLNDEIAYIIASKPGLKHAGFQGAKMTDELLSHFSQASLLEDLDLSQCSAVTDAGFGHLSKLTNLRRLGLDSTQVTTNGIAALKSANQLESLSMIWKGDGDEDSARIASACPNLKRLAVQHAFSAESLRQIAKIKNLSLLRLTKFNPSAPHLTALTEMASLSELSLEDSTISDFTALDAALKQMPMLKKVTVNGVARTLDIPVLSSISSATKESPFTNTLGMKFVPVPITGGPTDKQRVLFSVWETRVHDYEVFVKETKREWKKSGIEQGTTHPAVNMNCEDAMAFCAWLTETEHKAGKLDAQLAYRLPSDHEWSCAVGIGDKETATKTPEEKNIQINVFPWGNEWPPPADAGNYGGLELKPLIDSGRVMGGSTDLGEWEDSFIDSAPCGSFRASRDGLFDLGGNAFEWCNTPWSAQSEGAVIRGSSSKDGQRGRLWSSFRLEKSLITTSDNLGFRCVLAPVTPIP